MPDELAEKLEKLTRAQLRTFALIAMSQDLGVPPRTAAVLLEHGLIEAYEETKRRWPGPVVMTRYRVPRPVHAEWGRLCAESAESAKAGQGKR
jgi:hypothetical protein